MKWLVALEGQWREPLRTTSTVWGQLKRGQLQGFHQLPSSVTRVSNYGDQEWGERLCTKNQKGEAWTGQLNKVLPWLCPSELHVAKVTNKAQNWLSETWISTSHKQINCRNSSAIQPNQYFWSKIEHPLSKFTSTWPMGAAKFLRPGNNILRH